MLFIEGGGDHRLYRTFQIGSSAESAAFACDDSDAQAGLRIQPFPDVVELFVALGVYAVEAFWAV